MPEELTSREFLGVNNHSFGNDNRKMSNVEFKPSTLASESWIRFRPQRANGHKFQGRCIKRRNR
jgi:hypothetical protein